MKKEETKILMQQPCEDAISSEPRKIDEWDIKGKTAELWIVNGKLQIRYLGTIHNTDLPFVHPKSPWISVKDGLPENDEKVVILLKDNDACATTFNSIKDDWWFETDEGLQYKAMVSDWTPIPKYVKKEKDC